MMKKTKTSSRLLVLLCTMIACLVWSSGAFAQTRRVSGTVTTEGTNTPVAQVTVQVKGTNRTAVTNDAGVFNIDAASGETLVLSSVGYAGKEIRLGNQTILAITLSESAQTMDDVVVVGYGRMRRAEQSSAQTSISSADIQRTVNTTVEQAIQGRAAGVYVTQNTGQPGGGISVNIRGINTIGGTNEPLYVIDGVQIQPSTVNYGSAASTNPLAGLNPADIESMEILQGPAATAVYGSRGTNGVVLITTKRGKSGQLKVGYNYLYSLQDKPDDLPAMTLPQFAQMYNEITALIGAQTRDEYKDPSILGPGTNWQQALFKTAPLNKHQVTLSGGSNNTNFYLSGEYFSQEGVAIGSEFDRYSFRLNLDNQTRKWLKLSTNLSYNQTKESLGSTSENLINTAITMSPNVAVKNANGEWAGADETNGVSVQFTPLNPVAIANLVQNNLKRSGALGGFNIEITPLEGLVLRSSLNGNASWSNGSYFSPNYKLGSRPASIASLSLNNQTNMYWNWNQLVQYTTKIGDKHDISVMASHEAQESRWEGISGSRTGFVSNDVVALPLGNALGQQNSSFKGSWAMESYLGRINYSFADKYILQGAFRADGSANFGPDNRWGYFPSVSAAWRITEEPFMQNIGFINELKLRFETGLTGNQGDGGRIWSPLNSIGTPWGTGFLVGRYGNTGLKWEDTRTDNIGFNLSVLKNRIQLEGDYYIKKTNNLLLPNPLPSYMGTSGEGSIGTPTVNIGALQNKGWAFTLNTVNIDKKGFSWRSNFNISGFKTKVTKFYSEVAVIDRQPWYIGTGSSAAQGFLQRSAVGQQPWLFYGFISDGIFQSVDEINNSAVPAASGGGRLPTDPSGVWVGDIKYRDISGPEGKPDGIINHLDQTIIGNPWPKATMGLTNTFAYKGFDLNILLTGSFGNDVYNFVRFVNTNPNNVNLGRNMLAETFEYAKLSGTGNETVLSNPGTIIPRLTNGDPNGNAQRITNAFVEDGSYVRIKNVTLGYNVPQSVVSKARILQGARLSLGVQNLATFTKYKGFDPEVGAYVGQNVGPNDQLIGVDAGRYPLTRVYTFSLGVDF